MSSNKTPLTDGKGIKHDHGKVPWFLFPFDALEEVGKVLEYGAKKYAERNWEKGMAWSRLFGAMMRHIIAFWRGEDRDPETGLHHLAHAACCVLFLLAYALRKEHAERDDRPGGGKIEADPVPTPAASRGTGRPRAPAPQRNKAARTPVAKPGKRGR